MAQLFDCLITFDESGSALGLGAESWETSDDGLIYTFKLRPNATWSDGKPVVAEDYAWSWRRAIDPATASDYAYALYPIKNAGRIHRDGLSATELGVEVRGDHLLQVTLEAPAAYFPRLASLPVMSPLRRDSIEAAREEWVRPGKLVSNGPFALKDWVRGRHVRLDRRAEYAGPRPRIDAIRFSIFPVGGGEPVAAAYEAGDLDMTGSAAGFDIPGPYLSRVARDPEVLKTLRAFPQSATIFIVVNSRQPHLVDPRVRIALGMALSRREILEEVLRRVGLPASSLQPPGIAGRRPDLWPPEDIETARRLLQEAGYPEGRDFPEMTFAYDATPQWKRLADYLERRWKSILGITVKGKPIQAGAFLGWRQTDEWRAAGHLYRGGWVSEYEDPHNWYDTLWDSREDTVTFSSGWRNETFDAIVRRARGERDVNRRETIYGLAEEVLASEYPHIPLFHYGMQALVKPTVQNYRPSRVLGITPARTLWVDAPR
ncbi:MAG: peptide ABC transporter substrate-binding protein [Chloroflexota bacterium]